MEMAGAKVWMTLLVVVLISAAAGGRSVAAQVHHVVGDDRGWEPGTDLAPWFIGRVFRVGDIMWFAYSAAQESVVELETLEEFTSCDLRNPIRMYNGGLDKIPLERVGDRYFASGNLESCKKGLRLPVKVYPEELEVVAVAPTTPSRSTQLTGLSSAFFVGLLLCSLGL